MFASYLTTAAAAQLIGNIVIAVSLARRLLASELAISRFVLYRSVVFAVLGIYLLCIALLGLVFNRLGIAEDVFWGSMLVFVSALGLAALLLSDRARWRVKKFVVRNFYRTKYDYRQQWTDFTTRLGSLLSADDLAPVFLGMVVQNVGTPLGRILLEDPRDGRYYSMASVGPSTAMDALEPTSPLVAMLAVAPGPVVVGSECPADRLDLSPGDGFGDGSIVVPLRWRARLAGILILGPERTGALYTEEDREFLVTVAEQAAGAITTARLSESLAQAREFEAFTRITSFILHDLKNSVSALSMLSENAVKHLDDPEFRRDALSTLARTVERMTALMGRLTTSGADALHLAPVDVAAIAAEAARPLRNGNRVSLVQDLSAVPPVLGDADALLKVFQNVIANAAQSIDGDGVVTVRAYSESGRVVASVSDTGCGMSEEFIRRSLFSPFRSSKKGGWGIGLFQAKGIVEAHGGVIDVASKPGAGTTFSVRLPPHPEGTGR
jgi:putative PEP-CTERM system histidine kinase